MRTLSGTDRYDAATLARPPFNPRRCACPHIHDPYTRCQQARCMCSGVPSGANMPAPTPAHTRRVSHRPAPSERPRRFILRRTTDVSGVSGTGVIAEGVVFSTGRVALNWLGDKPAMNVHDSIEWVLDIHGHNGATVIEWLDK